MGQPVSVCERFDPDTLHWAERQLGVPVIDHWWQTETGWPIGANCVGLGMLPVKPGSPTKPVPGYDVRVLSEDNQEKIGRASCRERVWGTVGGGAVEE